MLLWIIIGVLALGGAVWAFWPRRRGLDDAAVRSGQRTEQGRVSPYDSGTGYGGSAF